MLFDEKGGYYLAFKFNKTTSTTILGVVVAAIGIAETIVSGIAESNARETMKAELKNELLEELKTDD